MAMQGTASSQAVTDRRDTYRSKNRHPHGRGEKRGCVRLRRDHPHGRGENPKQAFECAHKHGPSPRAWGKRKRLSGPEVAERTIPTGVGKTNIVVILGLLSWDHPHGRGENDKFWTRMPISTGPSPRAWGKRATGVVAAMANGTIPTGVGKTESVGPFTRTTADHPHGRGENLAFVYNHGIHAGPSPRAWGKHIDVDSRGAFDGTIPTGVGKTLAYIHYNVSITDHPHGRGENDSSRSPRGPEGGPSPRAWGKPISILQRIRKRRTIPTGVGKTSQKIQPIIYFADHPHGRGENCPSCATVGLKTGPSPRAWGKRGHHSREGSVAGTIPTGVGKTCHSSKTTRTLSDHPHGRGENFQCDTVTIQSSGPSPRAWGKHIPRPIENLIRGTIPTGVGKTGPRSSSPLVNPDHPHGRGENLIPRIPYRLRPGPSPRAWGKHTVPTKPVTPKRTIPTGVGKTRALGFGYCGNWDHPHGRGENDFVPSQAPVIGGPSPRAWGKQSLTIQIRKRSGTIPTGVGKTSPLRCSGYSQSDHPHGRGENRVNVQNGSSLRGPSPRAWGKPDDLALEQVVGGTIPTGVGKTQAGYTPPCSNQDHPHGRGENADKANTTTR